MTRFSRIGAFIAAFCAIQFSGCGGESKPPVAVGTGSLTAYGQPASAKLAYYKGVYAVVGLEDEITVEAGGTKWSFFGHVGEDGVFASTTVAFNGLPEIGAERGGRYFKVTGDKVEFAPGGDALVEPFFYKKP